MDFKNFSMSENGTQNVYYIKLKRSQYGIKQSKNPKIYDTIAYDITS